MISSKLLTSAAILAAALLAGCGDNSTPSGESSTPGPGERAGKAVDNAMDKAGQQIEKTGEDIQGAAKGEKK